MENYKVLGRAGEGAHGCVFEGLDLKSNNKIALKKIGINSQFGIPKNTLREICTMRALKHKNIVKLFDVTTMGSSVVLIMEFLPCSLQEICKITKLNLSQIKTYSKMLLQGVEFMHRNHIMHRDIKPANLLLSPKRILKIADFGLARIYDDQKPKRTYSHQVATRWYRAPELLYGSKNYTPTVDMWSVGCIIGEMINNSPLFPGETDIEQLAIVLNTLGTPTNESWPDLPQLPDYNKISFISSPGKSWNTIIFLSNNAEDLDTVDLIKKILIYNGKIRLNAKQALQHQFFLNNNPPLATLKTMPDPNNYQKNMIIDNITSYNSKEFDEFYSEIKNI